MSRLADDAVGAGGVDGPQNRADVVRILDPIDYDDERGPVSGGDQILDAEALGLLHLRNHALMAMPGTARETIELIGADAPHRDVLFLSQTDQRRQTVVGARRDAQRGDPPARSASSTGLMP